MQERQRRETGREVQYCPNCQARPARLAWLVGAIHDGHLGVSTVGGLNITFWANYWWVDVWREHEQWSIFTVYGSEGDDMALWCYANMPSHVRANWLVAHVQQPNRDANIYIYIS